MPLRLQYELHLYIARLYAEDRFIDLRCRNTAHSGVKAQRAFSRVSSDIQLLRSNGTCKRAAQLQQLPACTTVPESVRYVQQWKLHVLTF